MLSNQKTRTDKNMTTQNIKKTSIRAKYIGSGPDNGKCFNWKFYRDNYGWTLVDPNGYERFIGKTWLESVPVIQRVLSNHGMEAEIS